jgi:hypothetical protein
MSKLNKKQLRSLLGIASIHRLFIVLLVLGIGGLIVGIVALTKFIKEKRVADY